MRRIVVFFRGVGVRGFGTWDEANDASQPTYRYHASGIDRLYICNWTGAGCDARFEAGLTSPSGAPRAGYRHLRKVLPVYAR